MYIIGMLLVDREIKDLVRRGELVIDPFDEELVGPASLDLRLGNRFRVFKPSKLTHIDVRTFEDTKLGEEEKGGRRIEVYEYSDVVIADDYFVIHPGEFVLASVKEYIAFPPTVAGLLSGRSSIGRLGLLVHTVAGWIDPGYRGHLTLELVNVNSVPVKIYPGMRIAQVAFFRVNEVDTPYNKRKGSKYVDEEGATHSLIHRDFR